MFTKKSTVGQECHVILGNGPSLDEYKEIPGTTVWGVNRIFLAPIRIDYFLALDRHLWRHEVKKIEATKAKKYYLPARYKELAEMSIHMHKIETFDYAENPTDFLKDGKIGHGYTSVFAATQLAILAGAKEIQYFGVDWKAEPDRTHFYGTAQRRHKFWELGKKSFLVALNWLEKNNVPYRVNSHLFDRDLADSRKAAM